MKEVVCRKTPGGEPTLPHEGLAGLRLQNEAAARVLHMARWRRPTSDLQAAATPGEARPPWPYALCPRGKRSAEGCPVASLVREATRPRLSVNGLRQRHLVRKVARNAPALDLVREPSIRALIGLSLASGIRRIGSNRCFKPGQACFHMCNA